MKLINNENLNDIESTTLLTINGGSPADYNFGHSIGSEIRSGAEFLFSGVWNFIGPGETCY